MNKAQPCVGITGTGGCLGGHLARWFRGRGVRVREFRRSIPAGGAEDMVPFDLAESCPRDAFRDLDLLVHCAYDFRPRTRADLWRVNVDGSIACLRAAHVAGVPKLVFISSMSAFTGCRSQYGQAKLAVEREAAQVGAISPRLGLVWGAAGGAGLLSKLAQLVTRLPILPVVGGRQRLYLNHADDLADFLDRYLREAIRPSSAPFVLACQVPWEFRAILRGVANAAGKKPLFVPAPWRLVHALLRLGESCGLRLTFRSDSLLSLMNQEAAPSFKECHRLGLAFRDFAPADWLAAAKL